MGFTKALYYPTIDIYDEDWLKTAILFWDEIYTIVPSSMDTPYQTNTTQFLFEYNILKPLWVNPDDDIINELSDDALKYLHTNEGYQIFTQFDERHRLGMPDHIAPRSIIHRDKLPKILFDIHPEKLSNGLQYELRKSLKRNGWFSVDSGFAVFYLTLLANKLCERKSIGLLGDKLTIANFTDKVRLDNQIAISRNSTLSDQNSLHLAHGLMTNLIIQGVRFGKDSSIEDILKFKDLHLDELGLFRTNMAKLIQSVSNEVSLDALQQQVEDIYKDEFLPAYNNFKEALNSFRIKYFLNNLIKISFISTAATAFPTAFLGLTVPHALLAGAGISLVSSVVSYNLEKQKIINTNPYSYLLAVNNQV